MALVYDAIGDRLLTGFAGNSTARTVACRWRRGGFTYNSLPRIFQKSSDDTTADDGFKWYHSSGSECRLEVEFSGGTAQWGWALGSDNTWYAEAVAYDGGSTANDPVVYRGGSSLTVTENVAPSGSLVSPAGHYIVGNRPNAARGWEGDLAEFAVWNRALSAAELAAVSSWASPLLFPSGLVCYLPLVRSVYDHFNAAPTATGVDVSNHPSVVYPSRPMASVPSVTYADMAAQFAGAGSLAGALDAALVADFAASFAGVGSLAGALVAPQIVPSGDGPVGAIATYSDTKGGSIAPSGDGTVGSLGPTE